MLDEIQALGDVANGDKIIATLRAVLHQRRDILESVFTGSSQEAMVRMLSTAGSPMVVADAGAPLRRGVARVWAAIVHRRRVDWQC